MVRADSVIDKNQALILSAPNLLPRLMELLRVMNFNPPLALFGEKDAHSCFGLFWLVWLVFWMSEGGRVCACAHSLETNARNPVVGQFDRRFISIERGMHAPLCHLNHEALSQAFRYCVSRSVWCEGKAISKKRIGCYLSAV